MKRLFRSRLLWATLFGLLTAGLLFHYLRSLPAEVAEVKTVPVVTAAADVEPGVQLEPEMLQVVHWPEIAVLPGAIGSVAHAVGQVAAEPLVAGQPVLKHQIRPPEYVGHGGQVPLGMRLLTIATDNRSSIGYRLRRGDKVDVLAVYKDSEGLHAELALQAIEVYALGEETGDEPGRTTPKTLTLIVSPQDALLVAALAEEGSVRLMLRPYGDTEETSLTPVVLLRQ